jgi:ribose-phosphate pyrophosphokinase
VVVADLSRPNPKYLSLIYLLETLKTFGAASVGLVAPYLCYLRQDRRFHDGEALTSTIFAQDLSRHIEWLVTVDPHLHRYASLSEIYSVLNHVVHGASALANWLKEKTDVFLVGPDAESEQWVRAIADISGHPYVIGAKQRMGDRQVQVSLPPLERFAGKTAVIVDDVISSGHTILECLLVLQTRGIDNIICAAVHGIFADNCDEKLKSAGLKQLVTCNTIVHHSNCVDISPLLLEPIKTCIRDVGG